MRVLLTVLFFSILVRGYAQLPYTQKQYKDQVIANIVYGTDTAFDGRIDTLKLDLYKPVNDSNVNRPILIIVHGGAWLGGDKSDGGIAKLCHEFTSRGYLVASINYRMGMHPSSYYVPYVICPHEKCSYVADSAEWYRAVYRATQDLKSAIRYLKGRHVMDSSDFRNVYLLGESAGAFTSIHTAYTDQKSEIPSQAAALSNAPAVDDDLKSCILLNTNKNRPHLGDFEGKTNLNGYHSKVKGVAAMFGGVLDTAIFRQTDPSDTPVLYMYHQSCDVVVDPNKGRFFWKAFYYCYNPSNLCMPFSTGPISWGSTAIKTHITAMSGTKPTIQYTLLTGGGAYSCNPSSNCHGIDNVASRMSEIANFFAPVIQASGNKPGLKSYVSTPKYTLGQAKFFVSPNPASNTITIHSERPNSLDKITCILSGMEGKTVCTREFVTTSQSFVFDLPSGISNGIYVLLIQQNEQKQCIKLVINP